MSDDAMMRCDAQMTGATRCDVPVNDTDRTRPGDDAGEYVWRTVEAGARCVAGSVTGVPVR